jgi:hypothetical protein
MPIELKEALDGYVSEYELNSMSKRSFYLVEKLNPHPGLCWPCNYQIRLMQSIVVDVEKN